MEWGERQEDGTVIVYNDEGRPPRYESWETNQGLPPAGGGGGQQGPGWNSYSYGYVDQKLQEKQQEYLRQQLEFQRWAEEFRQQLERASNFGNPRNLAQSLFMLGQSPEQVSNTLGSMPLVRDLLDGGQFGINWTNNAGGNTASALLPQPNTPVATTQGLVPQGQQGQRNPLFPFVAGRHIPAQQGMQWMQGNSQMIPLLSGLASYSGQDPSSFWGDYQQALPQGSRNPLSNFI